MEPEIDVEDYRSSYSYLDNSGFNSSFTRSPSRTRGVEDLNISRNGWQHDADSGIRYLKPYICYLFQCFST